MKRFLLSILLVPMMLQAQQPEGWTTSEPGGSGTDLSVEQMYYSRGYQLLSGATPYMYSAEFDVTEGENYTFTLPVFDNEEAELKIYCEFLDVSDGDIYGESPVYSVNSESWQVISWTGTVPTDAVKGYVWVKVYDEDGFSTSADFKLGRPQFVANAGTNLVPDQDFILDEPTGAGLDLALVSPASGATQGELSAKYLLHTGAVPYVYSAEFDVTESDNYTFSIDILDNDLAELKVYCEFKDDAGDDIYGEAPQYSVNDADWQTISWTGTVPANAVTGYVWIKAYDEDGFTDPAVFYLDNASYVVGAGDNAVPNGGFESWIDPVQVSMDAQTVTNAAGQTVTARSNKADGSIYIVLDGEAQETVTDFDAAVTASKGAMASVSDADTDVTISTEGLSPGIYYAYAVDASDNLSEISTNYATIQPAAVTAVQTFFEDFEDGLPVEWTIINANEGDEDNGDDEHTWAVEAGSGNDDSDGLLLDTHPGPADDWFVSPLTKLTDGYVFSLWATGSTQYPDEVTIFVSKTGKEVADFTIELGTFEAPGPFTKFSFTPTDDDNLAADDEVYIAVYCGTHGSRMYVDDIRYGEFTFGNPQFAYSYNDDQVDVIFDGPVGGGDEVAANWTLMGTTDITFSTATVNAEDDRLLHLSGASETVTPDVTVDSIVNAASEYVKFYAGVAPLSMANISHAGGYLEEYSASFKVVVMHKNLEDDGTRTCVADASDVSGGMIVYGAQFYGLVSVGDEILIYSTVSPYNNQTELFAPTIVETISTGHSLFDPVTISGADLDTTIAADTNPAEKWEGTFVKVENAKLIAYDAPYFYMSDDNGATKFRVGNGFDIFTAPFGESLMAVGSTYDITGFVVNRDGDYRVVPRTAGDIVIKSEIANRTYNELMVYPNPASSYLGISNHEQLQKLSVYTIGGTKVLEVENVTDMIMVDHLAGGMYIIRAMTQEGETLLGKFIKQ